MLFIFFSLLSTLHDRPSRKQENDRSKALVRPRSWELARRSLGHTWA